MKTSELTGAELDYWVAKAAGYKDLYYRTPSFVGDWHYVKVGVDNQDYSPSTDWSQGGPIIEREGISVNPVDAGVWAAAVEVDRLAGESFMAYTNGPTPLIAAMRCFVASKFPDGVPDEETKA